MLDFRPDDEQQMLITAVNRFASEKVRKVFREAEESAKLPADVTAAGWEIGLLPTGLVYGNLGLTGELGASFSSLLTGLYQAVAENDLLLAEINPLVLTTDDEFFLIDAKVEVDSNALFRRKELAALYDSSEDDPLEVEARKHGLNYIRLHGNVGTIVNGKHGYYSAGRSRTCQFS